MRISDHVEAVAEQGRAAPYRRESAGLDADVPTCPGWTMRPLLGHVGMLHRWAATLVRKGMAAPQVVRIHARPRNPVTASRNGSPRGTSHWWRR